MSGNKIYVQGSYIDIHDNKVVNLSVDKGEVHVGQDNSDGDYSVDCDELAATDSLIVTAVLRLKDEGVLKHLYDYTWVMEVMNQTEDMSDFKSPASFIAYLRDAGVESLPSEDTINKKQNAFTGQFPDWKFTDCDTTEANRRINVGKRFLNIFRIG